MIDYAPPRGMRDFYPEDWRARRALFDACEDAARRWGFEFYDAPVVETLELLKRKAGEEISEQIYAFKDKSDRDLALRAEMTPSLARMIVARQGSLVFPLKWAAIAQCFRYERMTRGRKREHYQFNLDIVGEASVLAEAEAIGAAVGVLRSLGLTSAEVKVRVGSRALLAALFAKTGLAQEHFLPCCMALDKRGKIGDDEIKKLLETEGLSAAGIDQAFRLLGIGSLEQALAEFPGDQAAQAAAGELGELWRLAEALGFADWLAFDLGVIRGLGYYTGIVFEAFDAAGKFRAIFGGGRYERLLSDLGGQPMPCVGLGLGDVVIMELLADLGKAPATERRVDCAIGFMDAEASRGLALAIAAKLRAGGKSCDLGLAPEKPKKFFGRAAKIGAAEAIYIGPDEAARGEFAIKRLADGQQRRATL
jgi:histidyl-tRNA synthetase